MTEEPKPADASRRASGTGPPPATPPEGRPDRMDIRLSTPVRYLLIAAGVVIVLAGMRAAAPILSPLLLSAFLAIIAAPLLQWLMRRGLSGWAALLAIISGLAISGVLLIFFLSFSLRQFGETLPLYWTRFQELAASLQSLLEGVGVDGSVLLTPDTPGGGWLVELATSAFGTIQSVVIDIVFIVVATSFLLLDAPGLRRKLERGLGRDSALLERLAGCSQDLIAYLIIRFKINLIVAAGITVFLVLLGVDLALVWGVLAFFLGFIPYIGFVLTAIPPFFLALLEQGPEIAVIVVIGFVIINFVAENVLFPEMAGRGLNLSPFVVFTSVFFWAFILGGLGAFLSVPVTLVVKMLLESSEETRWLAELMSPADIRK
jgi:AI-2 transport protein TqsA